MATATEYKEENFPAWALCTLFNGNTSNLSDEDVEFFEAWEESWLCEADGDNISFDVVEGSENEFCANPAFGLATETVDLRVFVWR